MGLSSISSSDSIVNVPGLETGVLPIPVANLIQFRHFINNDNMLLTFSAEFSSCDTATNLTEASFIPQQACGQCCSHISFKLVTQKK